MRDFQGRRNRRGFEASAFFAGLDDVAVMCEAIEQRSRQLRIAEDAGPFSESEICRPSASKRLTRSGVKIGSRLTSPAKGHRAGLFAFRGTSGDAPDDKPVIV